MNHRNMILAAIAALALAVAVSPALAGKGGSAKGSGGSYPGTLTATPNTLHAGDSFDVTGCGYDTSLGNVIISFTGGGWGSALDASGCFTIQGIPALSGDTLPAGTYEVRALQLIRNKWTETGDTHVTVVP
jgi:hypothetical protein